MSPIAGALFLLSALLVFVILSGRLPGVWEALQGNGPRASGKA